MSRICKLLSRAVTVMASGLVMALNGYSLPLPTAVAKTVDDVPVSSLRVDSTLVMMDVLVTDEDGRILTEVKPGNFRISDNGKLQKLESFAPASAPITVVMLLEYSGASYNYFATKGATWAAQFLGHLEPQDWVALTTFDLRPRVKVDFTHIRYDVRDALMSLGQPLFSEANLFDAIIETLDKLDRVPGRKSIVLLSTGTNSFSSAALDDVLQRLQRTDTTIFVIGLAEQESIRYIGSNISYVQAKSWLTSFAKQTGGIAFFPRFEGELPEIFRGVVGYLRNEYRISFRPPTEMRDGKYHRLKVEIVGADGKPLKVSDERGHRHKVEVYARQGYVAPENKAE